jgi:threonine dehydratase
MTDSRFLAVHAAEVDAAAARIRPHLRRTPLLPTELDPGLLLKPECFQVTGSFKPRGAFNAILQLAEQSPRPKGVITASSGNHAQAVALAARTAGLKAVILIPEGANPAKVAATRALGAEVVTDGISFENRDQKLAEAVAERGLALVHAYDDWNVIHGQGTAALEVLQDAPATPALIATPVGGGGLLSGTAIATKAKSQAISVIGVEPERADDAYRSFTTKQRQRLTAAPDTIADGVRTLSIGARNFETLVENQTIDAIVTVTEQEIEEALLVAWQRLKLALEPTGALPLAAYLNGRLPKAKEGRPTVLILSGGNFDATTVARLLVR